MTSNQCDEENARMSLRSGRAFIAALGALVAGLMLTGCGERGGPPQGMQPEVAVVVVKTEPMLLTAELPGRASASLLAEVRPQVNGLIQKRLFTEGADVRAGDELYQIDPAPFEAALDNAKAALNRAEAALPALRARAERVTKALADKAVSQQDFDDADATLKQAEADMQVWKAMMKTASINLGYTKIVSPISGRIGKSTVTDGAIVTAYQPVPLATIQQLDPMYVDVPQSTTELLQLQRRLKEGLLNREGAEANHVKLILGDGTPYPVEGTLQFRDVSVDPSTATVILRMVFPNPNGVLLPGMFVRAVVEEGVNDHAILIPQQAVSRDPKGNPLAMVVGADSKVEVRPLTLDRAIRDQWLVSSGLAEGDRVIIEGLQKVRPGVPVNAVPFGSAPAPAGNAAQPAETSH